MVQIELDTFSGRPNPRWSLTEEQGHVFVARMRHEHVPFRRPQEVAAVLGYRGLVVRDEPADGAAFSRAGLPSSFRLFASPTVPDSAALELSLLDQARLQRVPEEVVDAARDSVTRVANTCCTTTVSPLSRLREQAGYNWVASSTDYSFWNNPDHQGLNNCYNYASNWRTDTFAQPGRESGTMYGALTVSEVTRAALRDGYRTRCRGGNLFVALVLWPGWDYHWYARTTDLADDCCFSHKIGGSPVQHVDNAGLPITDPRTCSRAPYTTWGGFFYGPGEARTTVQ
jgi:hypothetical protein